MIEVTLTVKADGFKAFTKGFPRKFQGQLIKAANEAGKFITTAVVSKWNADSIPPPLSGKYRDWKARLGFDPRTLIRSGMALSSVVFRRRGWGGWVGVPEGIAWHSDIGKTAKWRATTPHPRIPRARPNRKNIAPIMWLHEQGKGGMPKRALYGPLTVELSDRVAAIYHKYVGEALR